MLSALTGEGMAALLVAASADLRKDAKERTITLSASDGELIAWLHANGEVLSHDHEGLETRFVVRLSDADWARFQAWRRTRRLDQLLGPLPERFQLVNIHSFNGLAQSLRPCESAFRSARSLRAGRFRD